MSKDKNSLLRKLKIELGLVKFADFPMLEGDAVIRVDADMLEAGQTAMLVAADGTESPAPEGTHNLADGTVITVDANGMITEVKGVEVPEAETEIEVEMSRLKSENEALKAELETLKTNLSTANAEKEEAQTKLSKVEKMVVELSAEPAAKPIKPNGKKPEQVAEKVDLSKLTAQQRIDYKLYGTYK